MRGFATAVGLTLSGPLMIAMPAMATPATPLVLDYDASHQALVLRYAGTTLAFDTEEVPEGIRVWWSPRGPWRCGRAPSWRPAGRWWAGGRRAIGW